jgi:hypothetical protein
VSTKVRWHHLFPESWKFVPSKRLFPESKIRAGLDDEQLTASQEWGVIPQKEFIRRAGRRVVELNDHLDKRKRVEQDDFVISMRSFQGGLERAWAEGGIRSSYVVLKPSPEADVGYFARLFKCEQYIRALQATALFIRDGQDLSYQNFTLVDLPLPPKREQQQIARFLDYETARIDALIEKQHQLIALLKEQRQAVISHAVTKGLNPNAPLRDSGVEWLGMVPAHWGVSRLKHTSKVVDCRNKTPEYFDDGDYFVIRTTNVKNKTLQLDDDCLRTNRRNFEIWTQRGVPVAGSILFTREAPAGEVCLVPEGKMLCMGQRMMNFVPSNQLYTPYLFAYLMSDWLARYIESVSLGSTVSHLRVDQVENIPVPVPPDSEAIDIAEHVTMMRASMGSIIASGEAQIELLQERRTALISAAVTGKIDVRNWTPPESRPERDVA